MSLTVSVTIKEGRHTMLRDHKAIMMIVAITSLLAASSGTAFAVPDQIDCNSEESLDIRATAWNIVADWSDFEDYIEARTPYNIKSCLKNRLDYNGKVKCLSTYESWLGWASPFTKKIKVSQNFRDDLDAESSRPDRRACWAWIMAHEFSHSCDRGEAAADDIGNEAFYYWKDRFGVSANHDWWDCY